MTEKTLPWMIIAGLLGLGGFGTSQLADVTGARAFKERVSGEINQVEALRAEVQFLKGREALLEELLENCGR